MIFFTDIPTTQGQNKPILFQFEQKELPADLTFGKRTAMSKIEYPGGAITNQIIGIYPNEISWSGTFFGTYSADGKTLSAKERSELIYSLMGMPLFVGFPVEGQVSGDGANSNDYGGYKGIYIIEEYEQKVKNFLNVEYTIKLVPHQRHIRITPDDVSTVRVDIKPQIASAASKQAKEAAKATKRIPDLSKMTDQTQRFLDSTGLPDPAKYFTD